MTRPSADTEKKESWLVKASTSQRTEETGCAEIPGGSEEQLGFSALGLGAGCSFYGN